MATTNYTLRVDNADKQKAEYELIQRSQERGVLCIKPLKIDFIILLIH